jgi:hypothetical protein
LITESELIARRECTPRVMAVSDSLLDQLLALQSEALQDILA